MLVMILIGLKIKLKLLLLNIRKHILKRKGKEGIILKMMIRKVLLLLRMIWKGFRRRFRRRGIKAIRLGLLRYRFSL